MLQITNTKDIIEIPYLVSPGVAAIQQLKNFRIRMFRVDLVPVARIELTLERLTDDGTQTGPLLQFSIGDEAIQKLMDKGKFAKFVDHLEDFAAAHCPIPCEKIK